MGVEAGTRVFATVATEAPPRRRQLRQGEIHSVESCSCAEMFPGGSEPLASYWVSYGWQSYANGNKASSVRQVLVRHGQNTVLSYPADQVWRLAAPVRVENDTPLIEVNPRRMIVAEADHVLLSVDYSQLEVRIMAHFSRDARFLQILHSEGDVFRQVAASWLKKHEKDVTAEERSGAKRICYAIVYGQGAGRLATELGINRSQASEFQASFMREYAGVSTWIQACREQARQYGYVKTLQGRRRFLPALASTARLDRAHAERQAVNTACQASAADVVKTAQIKIHNKLKQIRTHEQDRCQMVARMILQMHDELIFEVKRSRLDEVRDIIVNEMIGAGNGLRVPLQVKWKVGSSWGCLV